MRHWLRRCGVGLTLLLAGMASLQAAPKQLELTFALMEQGHTIGTVKEQLVMTGARYALNSLTQGVGLYRLMGQRRMSSRGQVVANQLRPDHFESVPSKQAKKALITDFDWDKKRLTMQVKGEQETVPLSKGTQDLLSVMYCFIWQPPRATQLMVPVTNGKKLVSRKFVVSEESAPLTTPAGRFQVVKLSEVDGDKTLYLARDQGYLPVKLEIVDDGRKLEQVITSVRSQP